MSASPIFATLGPEGTNHEFVTRRYLAAHRLAAATVRLLRDFDEGLAALRSGEADYLVQCAAHPATAATTGRHFREVFVIDAFVAPSQPMAIARRADVAAPRSLALMPATQPYVDASRYDRMLHTPTFVAAGEAMLDGRADAALVSQAWADRHADRVVVGETLGAMTDGWLVYGRMPVTRDGEPVVWLDSPASVLYRRAAG
jgi:hypothetical protein